MLISEIDFAQHTGSDDSIFNNLYERKSNGYIIRNFFTSEETHTLKRIFHAYNNPVFKPYDGFSSLPRPFNLIKDKPMEDYMAETNFLHKELIESKVWETFNEKMKQIAGITTLMYATPDQADNFSKTWASIRELEIGKGYFEVHCGKLFHKWNVEFYEHFSQVADIHKHLSFFIMLQKPEIDCDIEVFDAHWSDINDKIGQDTLVYRNGEQIHINNINSNHINLREGDMFMFDEGNYWHLVPRFLGNTSRMTFGGFITKFKDEEKVMMWA